MLAKFVADHGDDADPQDGTQKIKNGETLPWHAEHARQWAGDDAQAEDEAREKDRDRAVLVKQPFSTLDGSDRNAKDVSVAVEQGAAARVSDGKSQVVVPKVAAQMPTRMM